MAWNGSGLFSRVHNWVTDKTNSVDITASRMDAEDDGFATGLNNCLTKNGENTPTADLPMGGFNHSGVDDGTARNHYASIAQTQDGAVLYAADSGAADAYVMTLSPAITAYATGQTFLMKAANANTGASTVNVNAVGAKAIVDSQNAALASGDIAAGQYYSLMYDGTSFRINSISLDADTLDGIDSTAFSLVDTYKGFNTNGRHDGFSGDLDTVDYNSLYNFAAASVTNEPAGILNWAFLRTMRYLGTGYATQICYSMDSGDGEVYMRRLDNSVWQPWVSIGQTTKAEVDALNVDADTLDGVHASEFLTTSSSASETVKGPVEQLTQTEVDTGTDTSRYPTIAKLLGGFAVLKSTNGYIRLPTWLGGVTVQWGLTATIGFDATSTITFPLAFTTACRSVQTTMAHTVTSEFVTRVSSVGTTSFALTSHGVAATHYWVAIGY